MELTLLENGKESNIDVAEEIMKTGLKIGESYGSINGNVYSLGIIGEDDKNIKQNIENYIWSSKPQTNVLVVYPPIIENSNGERIFLGCTKNPGKYDQDTTCSFMDQVCSKLGYIPNEFILGYYVDKEEKYGIKNEDESIDYQFERNQYFCNSDKVNDELFELMSKNIDENDKSVNEACVCAIDNMDIEPLKKEINSRNALCKLLGMKKKLKFYDMITDNVKEVLDRKNTLNRNNLKEWATDEKVISVDPEWEEILNFLEQESNPEKGNASEGTEIT